MNDLIYTAQQPKYFSSHTTMAYFSTGNTKNQYKKRLFLLLLVTSTSVRGCLKYDDF